MKIRVIETYIEADARELRESNSLSDNLMNALNSAFQSRKPFEDDQDEEESELETE